MEQHSLHTDNKVIFHHVFSNNYLKEYKKVIYVVCERNNNCMREPRPDINDPLHVRNMGDNEEDLDE